MRAQRRSARQLLRFRAVPSQDLASSACPLLRQLFRGTTCFSSSYLSHKLFPLAQHSTARRAPLRHANPPPKLEVPLPAPHEQGSCDYPRRGWLGTEVQRDRVICLKVAQDVGLGQERSRSSISRHSGCAQRASALHTSSPKQQWSMQPGDDKGPWGKPIVLRNADLLWENTKEAVPPEQKFSFSPKPNRSKLSLE